MNLCPCGKERVQKTTEVLRRLEGHTFVASVPALCCEGCREVSIDGHLLERVELLIARALLEAVAHEGGTFRFIRKSLGLSAVHTAELLGVAPKRVSQWENGKRSIDPVAFAILGALVNDALATRGTQAIERRRLELQDQQGLRG